ncbi:MAG: hypothetical protein ACFFFH_09205 [Candidatus Thorarchaeota archaeon]
MYFPALTDDPILKKRTFLKVHFAEALHAEAPHQGSRQNMLKTTLNCFIINFFAIIFGTLVYTSTVELFHFLAIYPESFDDIALFEDRENAPKINIPYKSLLLPILKLICEILWFFTWLFVAFFLALILLQFLMGILSSLLYLIELYLFIRKRMVYSTLEPKKDVLTIFDREDSYFILYIVGLLVFPFLSVIFICYIFPSLVAFVYLEIFSFVFDFLSPFISESPFTISVLHGLSNSIMKVFYIEFSIGKAVRLWIGLFWMLISLSIFNYRPVFLEDEINININLPKFTDYPKEEPKNGFNPSYIRSFATFFLLIFSPLISLAVVYSLQKTVFPLPFPLPSLSKTWF